ncbi:cable pilus major pilin CblA [Stenotrophomonas sp. SI-NJAU-1]|jgi:hypothetical protein|uniref:cable pilus major pilin CblA n=1 Tax=Stenotrophomonas TaxID=40323 RepID=UPI000E3E59B4|nr:MULTISPECIES: cable pilus major pilin CblA [Stenotrophomonas]MBO1749153.1 cable pilus major pilin CblA [Stenotrophomonas indicatrix]TPD97879.1 Cro/Cl family transcriptional regulator [Stenotrophomonas maltophilia]UEX17822.1 cable pilus major pilin CblA [Stenotrophomonas sp. SI-NJAU-1]
MLKFVPVAAIALMSISMSAHAVQKDITVTANVDTSLEILSADGSPLPTTMQMQYLPGQGLQTAQVMTKIFTNDVKKDLQVRLSADPALRNTTNPGAPDVPLAVKFGNANLTTKAETLSAAEIFSGDIKNGSNALPLSVAQKQAGALTEAGSYQGVVSVILTQSAASGG